jgi:hypothetical protein
LKAGPPVLMRADLLLFDRHIGAAMMPGMQWHEE